ncbi:MAG: Smr/MutS family protein [Candidatus Delongbacteria bacterium]|jgi:DNA mismatch repair protein MutS2|nr:Smr/MutS family protein [Candidatus Delongbacteria bacterium]
MIYPDNFEEKIGFDKLRDKLKGFCLSIATKQRVDDMHFMINAEQINRLLDYTEELKQILLFHESFPLSEFVDISKTLKRLDDTKSVLSEAEFDAIYNLLFTLNACRRFSSKLNKEKFPIIRGEFAHLNFPDFVKDEIRRIFTSKGKIKTTASKELETAIKKQKDIETQISRELDKIMQQVTAKGWADEDTSVAVIDGYRAIPVSSTHKRKLHGIIVGESASGKTVYIEPERITQYHYQLKNLEHDILKEKQRILAALTDSIRGYNDDIQAASDILVRMDFHRSKAKLALQLNAIKPPITTNGNTQFHKARHPVLVLNYLNRNKEVVPFDIEFNEKQSLFVISGPNAGGKTVCLQAAGLIQYMLQCGLQAPLGGNSEIKIIHDIFLDLGDDQNLENDLSTYSSHLQNMKFMLEHTSDKSMILIDEFGGGTEPEMGAAIAEAMLQNFADNGTTGIITTHYGNLKHFASNYPRLENAAMLIDNETMTPLYKLQTGIPGSSYSFDIAKRSGIPEHIIELAQRKTGKEKFNFDKHLRKVIKDKKYWENKRQEIDKKENKLNAELNRHSIAYQGFVRQEKKILEQAKAEAENIIQSANKEIENTIRKIKQANAEKEKTRAARQQLKDKEKKISHQDITPKKPPEIRNFKNSISQHPKQKKQPTATQADKEIRIGSKVYIKHLDKYGEVMDIGDKNFVVNIGNLISNIEKSKVTKADKQNQTTKQQQTSASSHYMNQIMNFQSNIDLRGMRVDEAINKLIAFIDDAEVLGVKEVKILHGKGSGILRQAIRDHLSSRQSVEYFGDEDIRFGGDGITAVRFRV